MTKYAMMTEGGYVNIRLSDYAMSEIKEYKERFGDDKAYDSIMELAQYDIQENMEYEGCYLYGWSSLCCMTWATCDYHDMYYCYDTDMIYDLAHYDIWHTLCEGETLSVKGEKVLNDDDRKDIERWVAEEYGYDDLYDDNDNESEVA